jgi:hypothetical protein
MKITLLVGLLLVCSVLMLLLGGCKGRTRGMNGQTFVADARPALAISPAASLNLWADGWCDVAPASQSTEKASAKLWFALYDSAATAPQQGRLVVLMGEGQGKWLWNAQPQPLGQKLHSSTTEIKNQAWHRSTLLLAPEQDPWAQAWGTTWAEGALVKRSSMLFMNRQTLLVVEYREPLPRQSLPVADDAPYLAAFDARAERMFSLARADQGASIPAVTRKLEPAPKQLSRALLARWVGGMHIQGAMPSN